MRFPHVITLSSLLSMCYFCFVIKFSTCVVLSMTLYSPRQWKLQTAGALQDKDLDMVQRISSDYFKKVCILLCGCLLMVHARLSPLIRKEEVSNYQYHPQKENHKSP